MDSRTKKICQIFGRGRDVFNERVKIYAVSEGCKGML